MITMDACEASALTVNGADSLEAVSKPMQLAEPSFP